MTYFKPAIILNDPTVELVQNNNGHTKPESGCNDAGGTGDSTTSSGAYEVDE